jgi:hypothetical protein
MSSQLKKDTARANGAKSRGPKTPEGQARSSANSRQHGLTARTLLLPGESVEDFQLLLADYVDQFHPATGVEMDLVEAMASARWRIRRLLAMETNLFDIEIVRRSKAIEKEFTGMDESARLGWVFQKLADDGQSIALLIRYETSLNRSYDRAFKQLQVIQSSRPSELPPPHSPASPGSDLHADLGSFRKMDRSGKIEPPPDSSTNTKDTAELSDTFRSSPPLIFVGCPS